MKKLLAFALIVSVWACKEEKKEPSVAETMKTYTISQMMDNESIAGGSFSPDKSKLLVSSNRSGIYNMYTIPTSGGEMMPVTQSDSSSVFAISYFPKDERMLFRMDNNGDEIYHIFVRDTDGSFKDLTPEEGARSLFYQWSEDKSAFFYGSNKRDNRFVDLYKMDLESMTSELVYENNDGYDVGVVSPDEKYVALSKSINTNDSDLFLYNLKSKELTQINENQSGNAPQDFSPDGMAFYYTTDDGSEFSYLMKYNMADASYEKAMERDWDISGSYFTDQGTYQVTYINEDAKNTIEVMEVA
ncbi:TolB family protein, partial [Flagellimonas sp.]